jgi:hypothetical protein
VPFRRICEPTEPGPRRCEFCTQVCGRSRGCRLPPGPAWAKQYVGGTYKKFPDITCGDSGPGRRGRSRAELAKLIDCVRKQLDLAALPELLEIASACRYRSLVTVDCAAGPTGGKEAADMDVELLLQTGLSSARKAGRTSQMVE